MELVKMCLPMVMLFVCFMIMIYFNPLHLLVFLYYRHVFYIKISSYSVCGHS